MSGEVAYRVVDGSAVAAAADLLGGDRSIPGYSGRETLRVLDTFDWRLKAAGMALALLERPGREAFLRCRRGNDLWTQPWSEGRLLGLAPDLPPTVLGRALAGAIGLRRILERLRVQREVREHLALDREGKTVAEVAAETNASVSSDDGAVAPLPEVVRIVEVRGYEGAGRRLSARADRHPALERLDGDDLGRAAALLGIDTTDPSKRRSQLDPGWRADRALRSVLLVLLETMEATEDGVREALDTEFLHDFRVAVRRSRAALGQVKGVLDPEATRLFKKEFRWLGRITGPTRDLDVYRLKIPSYRAELSAAQAGALEGLEEHLRARQVETQAVLARQLSTKRYRGIMREWRAFLESPLPDEPRAPRALEPILPVARHEIRRALDKVLRDGRAIDRETPTEALHRLRIDCKKLRYLLEFFRPLFPERPVDRFVRSLKRLQDNLGDLNDYSVQQASLLAFAEEMTSRGRAPAPTLLAMGRLQAHLEAGEAAERLRFHDCFAEFTRPKPLRSAERLFGSPGKGLS